MSKKISKLYSQKILEYTVVSTPNKQTGKVARVPRLATPKTVEMDELLARATMMGGIPGGAFVVRTQFELLMSVVKSFLEEGKAVNLDGYFRIQPYLTGKVDKTGRVSGKNGLVVRLTALAKLKMNIRSFAWRRKGDRAKEI